jgi:hypothetical protein
MAGKASRDMMKSMSRFCFPALPGSTAEINGNKTGVAIVCKKERNPSGGRRSDFWTSRMKYDIINCLGIDFFTGTERQTGGQNVREKEAQ